MKVNIGNIKSLIGVLSLVSVVVLMLMFWLSGSFTLFFRQVRDSLHPSRERHPRHRREVQRDAHPGQSLPGACGRAGTERGCWTRHSLRPRSGKRKHRWHTSAETHWILLAPCFFWLGVWRGSRHALTLNALIVSAEWFKQKDLGLLQIFLMDHIQNKSMSSL